MRSFAYKNENFEKDTYVPELKEGYKVINTVFFSNGIY
jgi:hypothetical protein